MTKLKEFIKNNYWFIFGGAIILYIALVFIFLIIKYNNFEYNGMDLAIFNQVFFNTSQGNLFHFTIHPHSYLGDHFTPFLLLLLPFYIPFQSPLTILFLQTVIIALCTIPIYFLAKHNLNKTWALILAILWLTNPMVINMNFFEFHLLPFAIFFLLFSIYFYQKQNLQLFAIFSLLSLSVREDVFLVILMFGILALFEKRKIKWIILPIILALAWFALAQIIITLHNPVDTYKFIPYYNWLGGNSMSAIAWSYITHPLEVLKHLFLPTNIVMFISLLMPFFFLPLLKPKYLLLSFLIYLQYALTSQGGGDLILKTHYLALFLPGIMISFILAIKAIYTSNKGSSRIIKFLRNYQSIILIILIISNIYLLFTLSPLKIKKTEKGINIKRLEGEIKQELLEEIPQYEAVATSYDFLPQLSTRPKLYSLNYAWQGYKELSESKYQVPTDLEYIYVDFSDIIKYEFQYLQKDVNYKYKKTYLNWQELFTKYNLSPFKIIDTYGIWRSNPNSNERTKEQESKILYEIIDKRNLNIQNSEELVINEEIKFLGWDLNEVSEINKLDKIKFQLLPLSLYFTKNIDENIKNNYQLQLSIGEYSKVYPLTYGFYPNSKWLNEEIIKINYWFLIPPELKGEEEITINLINAQGNLILNKNLSIIKRYSEMEILKPDIDLVW